MNKVNIPKGRIINSVYETLLNEYGEQGWWPIVDTAAGKSVYSEGRIPDNNERLEVVLGALLTQNTTWKNAEKALLSLKREGLINPQKLIETDITLLGELIRSSGYYNQKAGKIRDFLSWFSRYNYSFEVLMEMEIHKLREELLSVKGIGDETADSILLYSLGKKTFVVDAYTIRIFKRTGILSGREKYHEIREIFHSSFNGNGKEYNQYHALIVKHAKEICLPAGRGGSEPRCRICCINSRCKKLIP